MLVDAGGFKLHLDCKGSGSPTVIAEAGGGDFSIIWRHVQRAVARQTRFCSYDRAGFGWSEYSGEIPTTQQVSTDLRTALTNAGIEGPYIMAGHSLGGIYARDFSLRYPADVSGIVLVDSSHENQSLRTPEELKRRQDGALRVMRPMMQVCTAAAFTGLVRTIRFWHLATSDMTEEARTAYTVTRNRTRFCSAMRNSVSIFDEVMGRSTPPQGLGDIPLIVLGHGKSTAKTPAQSEWEVTWHTLQSELAALSSEGSYRIVRDAGHMIPIDNPEAVTNAILEMAARIRGSVASAKVK